MGELCLGEDLDWNPARPYYLTGGGGVGPDLMDQLVNESFTRLLRNRRPTQQEPLPTNEENVIDVGAMIEANRNEARGTGSQGMTEWRGEFGEEETRRWLHDADFTDIEVNHTSLFDTNSYIRGYKKEA